MKLLLAALLLPAAWLLGNPDITSAQAQGCRFLLDNCNQREEPEKKPPVQQQKRDEAQKPPKQEIRPSAPSQQRTSGHRQGSETKPHNRITAVVGGDQMIYCIRYKMRLGISQAIAGAACRNHVYMQHNYPAQAGVSNWCSL